MRELEDSIRGLEAREQERTQVHEGAKIQQAPSQAELTKAGLEKEFEKQLGQSFQEASQPLIDGQHQQVSSHEEQEKQVPSAHHVPTVSRFQERYKIMEEHGDERDNDPDPDKTP